MGKRRRIKGDLKMMETGVEPRGAVVGPMLVTRAVNSLQAKCGLAWCDQRRIGWSAHVPDMRTVMFNDSDVLYIVRKLKSHWVSLIPSKPYFFVLPKTLKKQQE